MKFYTSARAKINGGSAVALGCFDGVHIGHTKIISKTVEVAKENSLTSVVWSFQAPPKSILLNNFKETEYSQGLLTPLGEKKKLVRAIGADALICVPFNEKISKLSPREFFENIIINRLNAQRIFCGFNYRFGYKGSGDVELLRLMCEEFGIELTVFDEIKLGDATVSSTAIRSYLLDGEVEEAEKMLGRPFSLYGKVRDGQHLGRTLGFPTINQELPQGKILIKNGVYLTRVKFGKKIKYGITNIGLRPTVEGKFPVCETHILDFCGNLYGKYATVEFVKFIRPEKKFNSLEELTEQVQKDISDIKNELQP